MDDGPLGDIFDAVVVGTGLPESILAAALARAGQKVLHIDQNAHYGGAWATTTPRAFTQWVAERGPAATGSGEEADDDEADANESPEDTLRLAPLARPRTHAPFTPTEVWTISDERECDARSGGTDDRSCSAGATNRLPELPVSRDAVGALVITQFGLGVVTGYRAQTGMLVVSLDWELSDKATVKMHCLPSAVRVLPADGGGCTVRTVFGTGRVTQVPSPYEAFSYYANNDETENSDADKSYDMCTIELSGWSLANGHNPCLHVPVHKLVGIKALQHRHRYYRADARRRGPPPLTPLERVLYNDRRFSLDLCPHVMLCRGTAVDTLVRSGVHKYVEFISVDQIFVARDYRSLPVPGDTAAARESSPDTSTMLGSMRMMPLEPTQLPSEPPSHPTRIMPHGQSLHEKHDSLMTREEDSQEEVDSHHPRHPKTGG